MYILLSCSRKVVTMPMGLYVYINLDSPFLSTPTWKTDLQQTKKKLSIYAPFYTAMAYYMYSHTVMSKTLSQTFFVIPYNQGCNTTLRACQARVVPCAALYFFCRGGTSGPLRKVSQPGKVTKFRLLLYV